MNGSNKIKLLVRDKRFNLNLMLNFLLLLSFVAFLIIQRTLVVDSTLNEILFPELVIVDVLLAIGIAIEVVILVIKGSRITKRNNKK